MSPFASRVLQVSAEVVEDGNVTTADETFAAAIPGGVLVRHTMAIGVPGDARMVESMLYIHGGHVHDLGGGRGQLVGA